MSKQRKNPPQQAPVAGPVMPLCFDGQDAQHLYGNQWAKDMLAAQKNATPERDTHGTAASKSKMDVGSLQKKSTLLPRGKNVAKMMRPGGPMQAVVQPGLPLAESLKIAEEASDLSRAQKAMKLAKAGDSVLGPTLGLIGGIGNMVRGAEAFRDANGDAQHQSEGVLQGVEGLTGAGGALMGLGGAGATPVGAALAGGATGLMLGRSSNDYYRKHTGKSLSEWVGDLTGDSWNFGVAGAEWLTKDWEDGIAKDVAQTSVKTMGGVAAGTTFLVGTSVAGAMAFGGGIMQMGDEILGMFTD